MQPKLVALMLLAAAAAAVEMPPLVGQGAAPASKDPFAPLVSGQEPLIAPLPGMETPAAAPPEASAAPAAEEAALLQQAEGALGGGAAGSNGGASAAFEPAGALAAPQRSNFCECRRTPSLLPAAAAATRLHLTSPPPATRAASLISLLDPPPSFAMPPLSAAQQAAVPRLRAQRQGVGTVSVHRKGTPAAVRGRRSATCPTHTRAPLTAAAATGTWAALMRPGGPAAWGTCLTFFAHSLWVRGRGGKGEQGAGLKGSERMDVCNSPWRQPSSCTPTPPHLTRVPAALPEQLFRSSEACGACVRIWCVDSVCLDPLGERGQGAGWCSVTQRAGANRASAPPPLPPTHSSLRPPAHCSGQRDLHGGRLLPRVPRGRPAGGSARVCQPHGRGCEHLASAAGRVGARALRPAHRRWPGTRGGACGWTGQRCRRIYWPPVRRHRCLQRRRHQNAGEPQQQPHLPLPQLLKPQAAAARCVHQRHRHPTHPLRCAAAGPATGRVEPAYAELPVCLPSPPLPQARGSSTARPPPSCARRRLIWCWCRRRDSASPRG